MLFHRFSIDRIQASAEKHSFRQTWMRRLIATNSFPTFLGAAIVLLSSLLEMVAMGRQADENLPAPEFVLQKVIEKARQAQSLSLPHQYEFQRSVLTEELDGKGESKKRRQRLYRMVQIPGELNARRIRQFSGEEVVLQGQEPKKERETKGNRNERMEFKLDDNLVNRFAFKVAGRDYINRRASLLLIFEPKPNLPVNRMEDRIINKIRGRAWVDEQDFEVARLELTLSDNVALAWGILGNLHRFDLVLERAKVDNTMWLNQATSGFVEYRKVLASKSIRWQEQMSGFQKVYYTPEQLKAMGR